MQTEIEEYRKKNNRIANAVYQKALRSLCKQHSLCRICHKEDADEGMSTCGKCRAKIAFMKIVTRISLGLPVKSYDPYPEEEKFEWELRNCRNCGKLISTNEDSHFCSTDCIRSYCRSGKAGTYNNMNEY